MTEYRASSYIPNLVQKAIALAEQQGFEASCTMEVGRLLRMAASQYQVGLIGEIGTGCGVGAAWIIEGLSPRASFLTIELDQPRAAATKALFEPFPNVQVLCGDWHGILRYAPFTMLFVDGGKAKQYEPGVVLQALRIGGLIVLDDLTPESQWPDDWRGKPDPVRQFWLNDSRLNATELLVTPSSAVILATRVG